MRTIDHYVAVVPDQEAGRAAFARLGFHVRPTATHIEFGSSNAVVIFPHTYLELLYLAHARDILKAQYDGCDLGLAHVSLWSDSLADERARLQALGYTPGPEGNARRKVVLPDGSEGETDSSFLYNWASRNRFLSIFHSEHRRPAMNYIEGYTGHPNGAVDLARVAGASQQPGDDLGYYRDSWAREPEQADDTGFAFRGARGEVMEVRTPAALHARYGDLFDAVPGAAAGGIQVALHYRVKDRAATQAWLDERGVVTVALADGIAVAPQEAEGMILVFE
ncbi:MAG: hypothetical protein CVT80_00580 [Alphaproteobacteria bacterium HGW-Alphaproteobacteria-2]|nr:MAG: hypothetical protein CVT80_00580 [Alphaproteobacteria bacterium HGW-Alphaproteobacteria-2]